MFMTKNKLDEAIKTAVWEAEEKWALKRRIDELCERYYKLGDKIAELEARIDELTCKKDQEG